MLQTSSGLFLAFITVTVSNLAFGKDLCLPVKAIGFGQDQGEGQTLAWVTGSPLLFGKTQGSFQVESMSGSLAAVAGTVEFESFQGSFRLVAKGSFDLATGKFTTAGPLEGGSGVFAATRGHLQIDGSQDLETGRFVETIRGAICWADHELSSDEAEFSE